MVDRRMEQYRVCDQDHEVEVEAAVTDTVVLNGHRWQMDNCQQHSAALEAALQPFLERAVKTGEPTPITRQRVHKTVVVPNKRPAPPPVAAELRRQAAMAREPLPASAERWRLTSHAEQRRQRRQLDLYEILMTAERPESEKTSQHPEHRGNPALRVRQRGDVQIVVNPKLWTVVTVLTREGEYDLPPANEFHLPPTPSQKASA